MKYADTLKYLDSLQPTTFRMELGPLIEACHLMGEPQKKIPAVHISGTNGKGSTAAFIAQILEESGYRTGLYTSPHLVDIRERVQIDRKMIGEAELAKLVTEIRDVLPNDRKLSYFEVLTLASFLYFSAKKADIAVFETGLGGRLDATNIIEPLVTVITPVSFDHTLHLGQSLREIALEKCGIIKRGIPTVVAYQAPEVMGVVKGVCDEVGSPLCIASPDEIRTELGLAGEHQRQNAACAVEAVRLLEHSGFKMKDIEGALLAARWPGRMETVRTSPRVILDGAHNVAGAENLASYVRTVAKRERSVLLLGVLSDKDVGGIIRPLAPLFREIVCVRAPSPRAASPKDLAAAVRSSGATVTVEKDVRTALKGLMSKLEKDETLVVSGSLTVIGEALGFFGKKK